MSERANQILDEALGLDAEERASIISRLLSSLDSPDPRVEKLWVEEVRDRLAAYEAGEMRAVPAEEVYAELGLLGRYATWNRRLMTSGKLSSIMTNLPNPRQILSGSVSCLGEPHRSASSSIAGRGRRLPSTATPTFPICHCLPSAR